MKFGSGDKGPGSAASEGEAEGALDANSGFIAFATLLALHRIADEPAQLRHDLRYQGHVTSCDLLRLAKGEDCVRARCIIESREGLTPSVLANSPQGWLLIGKATGDRALIQCPGRTPEQIARAALEALWSGELILTTTREDVGGLAGRFDVTWFIPQIVNSRRPIVEVLGITLALNLLSSGATGDERLGLVYVGRTHLDRAEIALCYLRSIDNRYRRYSNRRAQHNELPH